jgi:hypothetical protein
MPSGMNKRLASAASVMTKSELGCGITAPELNTCLIGD